MTRHLLRDLVRYAPGQLVPIVLATLSMVIFTRLATPEAYGTFILVSALATTVSSPFGQWLMQGVLRFTRALPAMAGKRSSCSPFPSWR